MSTRQHSWPSKDGLRISHLNINHAVNKITDISSLLNNNGKPFHILGLSESRLSNHINDTDMYIPGYKIIRKDAKKAKETGLLVYASESINFKRLYHLENQGIESLWIEIRLKNTPSILLGFCYRNPTERVNWLDNFSEMMDAVSIESKEIILLGDFNIDLSKANNQWTQTINYFNLYQLIESPTRITSSSQTIIDHIYVSNKNHILEACVPFYNCSDHFPVCLTWSKKGIKIPKPGHKTVTYRCFSKFNQELFLQALSNSNLPSTFNITDPDAAIDFWIKTFTDIYNTHAPLKTIRVKHFPKPPWMSKEVQEACYLRDFLKKHGYHEESRLLRNAINSQKRREKRTYYRDLLSSKENSKQVWQVINQLTNKQSSSRSNVIKDISAEELNTHFTTIPNKIIHIDHTKTNNLTELKHFCNEKHITSELNIPPMSIFEVFNYLSHLKQSGTRSLDGIDSRILKLSAPVITDTLTYIFNLCIDKNHFPSAFKKAKVIPIYKTGDKSDPTNYRPISIISILSKPLEKHINKHLLRHLESHKLLHPNQSGFRQKHSCHTALINLVDNWLSNINESKYCGVLFIDFKKAFDVIDHDLLLRKLKLYGLSSSTLILLDSYLTNRKQIVSTCTSVSSLKSVDYGVPQGSILGPLLFSIYINDLPLYITSMCELFADDTTIHASHKDLNILANTLQESINNLLKWTELNHMVLHPQKTKCMLITTRQKRQNLSHELPPIYIKNQTIEQVTHHKVLGVTIDNNLSWYHHIHNLCKLIAPKVYQLSKIKHFLDFHSRKLFFQAHIQSSIDYASTLWDSASANTMKHLLSLHKRALKLILLKNTTLSKTDYNQLNILPLQSRLKYNKGLMMHKIMTGKAPPTLNDKFSIVNSRNTRKLCIPIPRIDLFKSSLCYSGSTLWNSLPESIKLIQCTTTFKKHYFIHMKNF